MADRPILKVAKLSVVGDRFQLESLGSAFDVPPGAEVDVAFLYDWEEQSREREDIRFTFDVTVEGQPGKASEIAVTDRPVVHDRQYGVLARTIRAPRSGLMAGRWRIAAKYAKGPWGFSAKEHEANFATEGMFVLRAGPGTG